MTPTHQDTPEPDRLYQRGVTKRATRFLNISPVLKIHGARQVGKSTLASLLGESISASGTPVVHTTLDDPFNLQWAQDSPTEFVEQAGNGLLIIDEIQRAPQLTVAIKASVDRDRRPGRFIITGSSDYARLAGTKDSLAGRSMGITLHPLALAEKYAPAAAPAAATPFIDRVLDRAIATPHNHHPAPSAQVRRRWARDVAQGGFPPAVKLSLADAHHWHSAFLNDVIGFDHQDHNPARPVSHARLKTVARLLAAQQAQEIAPAKVAREAGIPESSIRLYLDTLERLNMWHQIPAWKANLTAREVSKHKSLLVDTGLATYLAGQTADTLADPSHPSGYIGQAIEGLVFGELLAQAGWAETEYQLFHWRDSTGKEVDIISETLAGDVVAIEVKSGQVKPDHFKHLRFLAEHLGSRLKAGIVLSPLSTYQRLSDTLYSLPLETLIA